MSNIAWRFALGTRNQTENGAWDSDTSSTVRLAYSNAKREEPLRLAPSSVERFCATRNSNLFKGPFERGVGFIQKARKLNKASSAGWYHSAMFHYLYRRRPHGKRSNAQRSRRRRRSAMLMTERIHPDLIYIWSKGTEPRR